MPASATASRLPASSANLSVPSILALANAISTEGYSLRATSFHALVALMAHTVEAAPFASLANLPRRSNNGIRAFVTALKGGAESWKASAAAANHSLEATDRLFSMKYEIASDKTIRVLIRYDTLEEAEPCRKGDICIHGED